jgi:hypothetical protein
VDNQRLFWNFDTLKDYCDYLLHIQGPKWLLPHIINENICTPKLVLTAICMDQYGQKLVLSPIIVRNNSKFSTLFHIIQLN